MLQRPPRVFFACLLTAGLFLAREGAVFGRVETDKGGRAAVAVPEKPPVASIPPVRAEPVVPPSAAKSIASQLNDAYVSVFEHVAPSVVVIDVLKHTEPESDPEFLSERYAPSPSPTPAPDKNGVASGKDKDKGKPDSKEKDVKPPDEPPRVPLRRPLSSSEGSGFIIQSSGFILTNNHVINGAEKINVRLKDGRQFKGRVAGADKDTDIAVVKIDATDLPTAELANSDSVRVGQIACAIGVPYNQDYSFTAGVVSAKNRYKLTPDDIGYDDYIQTDASINPGNSGGPLVDLDGKVIGMNTLINGFNRGLGFAIPSNMLREVGDQLMRSGRVVRSYLGVRIESLNTAVERYGPVFGPVKKGVVVLMITPDSPAMRSGDLRPSDVITDVDGISVGTDRELQKQILTKKIGATVQLTVVRKTKTFKVAVTTAELPSEPAPVFSRTEEGELAPPVGEPQPSAVPATPPSSASPARGGGVTGEGGTLYGLQVQDVTRDIAAGMNLSGGAAGVLVTDVQDNSAAEKSGLAVRDVITTVDERPVKDVAAFKEALRVGDARRGIVCYVDRLGAKLFVVLKAE